MKGWKKITKFKPDNFYLFIVQLKFQKNRKIKNM